MTIHRAGPALPGPGLTHQLPGGPLVSSAWLEGRLGAPDLRVLDASWYLPAAGRDARAEYLAGHIPGAVFFDLDAASDPRSPWPHMLPTADEFARLAGSLGIGDHTQVVIYDGSGTNLSAARAWWMFRAFGHRAVAVLDGGLGKWKAEGRPLEAGPVAVTPEHFQARLDASQVRTLEEVQRALAEGQAQVVDLRAAGRFAGAEPEPRPIPSGHIPGSLNLPYTALVRPDGTLRSREDLRRVLVESGIDPAKPVIALCGSGTSACTLLLALEVLETGGHALYDGSWTEWASRGMPVARCEPA